MTRNGLIAGVVLAGGRGTRMGEGDKCLRRLGNQFLLDHVLSRAAPQVGTLLINGNGDKMRFSQFPYPVIEDAVPGYAGPLAGVLAAIDYVRSACPGVRWVASFAADTPWFPDNLVERLLLALQRDRAQIAIAASGERTHPVFALWTLDIEDALRTTLMNEHSRGVQAFQQRHATTTVSWPVTSHDPFFNINTAQDLALAELQLPRVLR